MGDFSPSSGPPAQLSLPLIALRDTSNSDLRLPRTERVYVNRNLALGQVDWIGFDMDYTLAVYQQEAMDALSVEVTVENLLGMGYPNSLRDLRYDIRFPIRGLLIDKQLGNVLKMDRFGGIHKGYHGFCRVDKELLHDLYWRTKVRPDSERFHWIDTLFGLSEVTSYVSIVEALERRGDRIHYERLFDDIRKAIDLAHASGEVHQKVADDLPRFIAKDEHLALTLHKLRSAGKKLFLLTNSPWDYTDRMMSYLLSDELQEYRQWPHYFDVLVVSARKPVWFNGKEPFVSLEVPGPVTSLGRGKVYAGGNVRDFERLTGISGARVMYVGDHIYGDIVRSKKESTWRTAMIIQEMDAELGAHERSGAAITKKLRLDEQRSHQEDELRFYQRRLRAIERSGVASDAGEASRVRRGIETVRRTLRDMNQEQEKLERFIDDSFHPYWGSLLKESGELSSFGAQVARYADVYTRSVSCLRHYSGEQYFRSPHDFMPHEL